MPWKSLPRPRPAGATTADALRRRSRGTLLAVAGVVVLAGLVLRSAPGAPGDVGGGILYAVLLFLLVAVFSPAAPAARIGAISLGTCVVVEFLQLTDLPRIAAELVPPIRYVLGTTFVASDLLAYLGGTLLAVVIDRIAFRRAARSSRTTQ